MWHGYCWFLQVTTHACFYSYTVFLEFVITICIIFGNLCLVCLQCTIQIWTDHHCSAHFQESSPMCSIYPLINLILTLFAWITIIHLCPIPFSSYPYSLKQLVWAPGVYEAGHPYWLLEGGVVPDIVAPSLHPQHRKQETQGKVSLNNGHHIWHS